jgi:hypothetical protein
MARFEGACAHVPLRDRDGVDFEGVAFVDFVGVRSGSGNSPGWPRVETIFALLVCLFSLVDVDNGKRCIDTSLAAFGKPGCGFKRGELGLLFRTSA